MAVIVVGAHRGGVKEGNGGGRTAQAAMPLPPLDSPIISEEWGLVWDLLQDFCMFHTPMTLLQHRCENRLVKATGVRNPMKSATIKANRVYCFFDYFRVGEYKAHGG